MESLTEDFNKNKSPSPIIIFGSPRSGTTYLLEIINQHPDINITYESRVFRWLFITQKKVPKNEAALYKNKDVFLKIARRSATKTIQTFYQKVSPKEFYWGDKNPFYGVSIDILETIEEFFPGSKYIHIIRDPRDVITSLTRKKNDQGQAWSTFEDALNIWLQHVTHGCQFPTKNPDITYLEIKYEDLVENDVETAKKIFKFLNIEISDSVIEFCREQTNNRTILSGPTRDLEKRSALDSEWETYLNKKQQLECLEKTGPWLAKFNYMTLESLHKHKFHLKKDINHGQDKNK